MSTVNATGKCEDLPAHWAFIVTYLSTIHLAHISHNIRFQTTVLSIQWKNKLTNGDSEERLLGQMACADSIRHQSVVGTILP